MYSFIILHYNNMAETVKCLQYLKKIDNDDINIIVVDNNTLSSKEEEVLKEYTNDILKLDKNYGFAKANNKGVKYALKKYNSKYYIVMNNDVFISQSNFIDIIDGDYHKYHFDVLGPMIDSPIGESVNPFHAYKTTKEVIYEINKCKKLLYIYNSKYLYFLLNVFLKIKHLIKKCEKVKNGDIIEKNVALHGCCLVFSSKYVKKYKDVFYNETFLFHEEEFLYQRIIRDNLISVYDPNLKVYHKEGSSIKKNNSNNQRLSLVFRTKERLKSLELLLEFMEELK